MSPDPGDQEVPASSLLAAPSTDPGGARAGRDAWLTPGVRGIGLASLFADLGHEIPTALMASFMTSVLGAPAAVLGLIEGLADAASGVAKVAGGALADDPTRRRNVALGGYVMTALLSAATGLATTAWQVGVLRTAAWTARGIRGPARNALLADAVDPSAFGRAYGFERAMDNMGAVIGPVVALVLVAAVGIRGAILLSVIPGLIAAAAIAYAIRHLRSDEVREHRPFKIIIRPLMKGRLGRLLGAMTAFEMGNVATSLLILRATELFIPSLGTDKAAMAGIGLYIAYTAAATLSSLPAGHLADRIGAPRVLGGGVALFAVAYALLAVTGPNVLVLGVAFVAAGVGIGSVETAERATVAQAAPEAVRGSAFGLLAAIQAVGDLVASAVVGLVWTLVSPVAAFALAAGAMVVALVALLGLTARGGGEGAAVEAADGATGA